MNDARETIAAGNPATEIGELTALAASQDQPVLLALIANPSTPTEALRIVARSPRVGVRKALLASDRCPLVDCIAEDRLAYEGVDIGIFVDERSRRSICRQLIGTAHRAETELLFSDPSFRILDCLRTLHSLFTIHGGKKRDRKLNRHDYLRFLTDFNARGGDKDVLDLPFITLLTGIRLLGQERLVRVMTADTPARAVHSLRLLEAVVGRDESNREPQLFQRWVSRHTDWPQRIHDYLDRKYKRRAQIRRNRPPRALFQARLAEEVRQFNRDEGGRGARIHLPRTERELEALGATMANCVGSKHNIDDAVAGRHLILHAHPPAARRRGATCQFSAGGDLLQARGFANEPADPELIACAQRAMIQLRASVAFSEFEDQREGP